MFVCYAEEIFTSNDDDALKNIWRDVENTLQHLMSPMKVAI